MCLNPFVLDFFALARGYGMGLGCMMACLACILLYLKHNSDGRWLAAAYFFAMLSVFANLIFVAFYVALSGALLYGMTGMFSRVRNKRSGVLFVKRGLVPLLTTALLLFYFVVPVRYLSAGGEFNYGASTLGGMWFEFAQDSLYGMTYAGSATPRIAGIIAALIVTVSVVLPLVKKSTTPEGRLGKHVAAIVALLILFFILNHWIMGASYPAGRKSILLFPVMGLAVFAASTHLSATWHRLRQFGGMLIVVLLVAHTVHVYHPGIFREWWYDASTRDMVHYVAGEHSGSKAPTLAVEWIFHPASHFYIDTELLPVDLKQTGKLVSPDANTDFYYIHPEHLEKLTERYTPHKNFGGRLLLQRQRSDTD
ncbi:MAG: hypothetical protein R3330_06585 [Saprospiraceae bacterium]|nr:hypothetical protein [Saprospiraceae bacterium]